MQGQTLRGTINGRSPKIYKKRTFIKKAKKKFNFKNTKNLKKKIKNLIKKDKRELK